MNTVLLVDGGGTQGRVRSLALLLETSSDRVTSASTAPEDPAMIIYTSGTTGPPKGVLHAHRVLIGQAPGFRLAHDFLPRPGDLVWTPADWAWIGGLVNTLFLAWFQGVPMVSAPRRGFDPEWALDLLARMEVRNTFLPTTALRMMLQHPVPPEVRLRSILSGGEPQEADLLAATEAAFGVMSNESYGQTEADFVVGHCGSVWPVRAGSMGRAYPGHQVELRSDTGAEVAAGEVGEVVVRAPDPTILLRYWNRPDATAGKFRDGWLRTGDLARMDEDGYLWFEARADDIIKSAGYRIGPGEIEDCLLRHPDVAQVAVVGAPDEVRGQVVKAYVSLRPGTSPSEALENALRGHVRERLAAYQYPRLIEFVTEFPMTTSGKVDRALLRRRAVSSTQRPS
jgi:acetyl-CoA synthetase